MKRIDLFSLHMHALTFNNFVYGLFINFQDKKTCFILITHNKISTRS